MAKSFFNTNEYKFMKQLQERMSVLNTNKNTIIFKKYLAKCKEMVQSDYNNVGWREETQSYLWDKSKEVDEYIIYNNLGDDKEGLSFYRDTTLFMSDCKTYWALKDKNNIVVKYSPEETEEIRFLTTKKLIKVHETKVMFEGDVIGGDEKRELASKQVKEKVK